DSGTDSGTGGDTPARGSAEDAPAQEAAGLASDAATEEDEGSDQDAQAAEEAPAADPVMVLFQAPDLSVVEKAR
ncbi:hypothetical protein ACP3WF_24505, partial [Salmonella enterica]